MRWPRTSSSLDAHEDMDTVALCVDLPELMAAAERYVPDVVLTDIRMPPTGSDEGIRAAAQIRGDLVVDL